MTVEEIATKILEASSALDKVRFPGGDQNPHGVRDLIYSAGSDIRSGALYNNDSKIKQGLALLHFVESVLADMNFEGHSELLAVRQTVIESSAALVSEGYTHIRLK